MGTADPPLVFSTNLSQPSNYFPRCFKLLPVDLIGGLNDLGAQGVTRRLVARTKACEGLRASPGSR